MNNKIAFFLFSLLIISQISFAESVTFWKGFVFIGGQPASNGTVLEAFVNNATLVANYTIGTINSGRDGYYLIPVVVATIDGGHNVSFRVNGVYPYTGGNASDASLQAVNKIVDNLLNISINLTANGGACMPYGNVANSTSYAHSGCSGSFCVHDLCRSAGTHCGDGFCDSGESSSSCSSDCGAAAASSSGGGGGGGAAVTAVEEKVTIDTIPANTPMVIDITKTKELAVDEIVITTNTVATSVAVTVKESSKPADAPAPVSTAGVVYKYVEITVANITASSISTAKVKFKVTKSWITSNGIDANTVKLNRYVGTDWIKLATSKVSEDGTDITYEADTPGFSTFAITGEKVATATPTPAPVTTATPVATPQTVPVTTPRPVPSAAPAPGINMLALLFAIALIILLVGYYHTKAKKKVSE